MTTTARLKHEQGTNGKPKRSMPNGKPNGSIASENGKRRSDTSICDEWPLTEPGWRVFILDGYDDDHGETGEMTLWEALRTAWAFNAEALNNAELFGEPRIDVPTKAILVPPGVLMYGEKDRAGD